MEATASTTTIPAFFAEIAAILIARARRDIRRNRAIQLLREHERLLGLWRGLWALYALFDLLPVTSFLCRVLPDVDNLLPLPPRCGRGLDLGDTDIRFLL